MRGSEMGSRVRRITSAHGASQVNVSNSTLISRDFRLWPTYSLAPLRASKSTKGCKHVLAV